MGRERQAEQRSEQFTKLVRVMMETPAWRALTPTAQTLYPWLRLEWRGAQANNNGKIQLSKQGNRKPDSAAEQEIARLMETGLDRNTAINIADGVWVVSRDPQTGEAQIIDKATCLRNEFLHLMPNFGLA